MRGAVGGTKLDRGFARMRDLRSRQRVATVQHRNRKLHDQREQADGRRETASEAGTRDARKNVHDGRRR